MHLLRISRERIDAIKARVDLATIVAERGITLQRKGQHLFALCPFHQETHSVLRRNAAPRALPLLWLRDRCGDAIGFLVRYDRVSFPEAVRMLAARAGVELEAFELRREDLCGRTS